MSPKRYRKKPIEITAIQWTGNNDLDIYDFVGARKFVVIDPDDHGEDPDCTAELFVSANSTWVLIETGEWIIRDARGCYPCKPGIFEETYEVVQP